MPFVPQLDAADARHVLAGSGAPGATLLHTPRLSGSAQDLHALAQAEAQQTPCAQKPDEHSALFEQNAPLVFFPHELPLQTFGVTQFPFTEQASKQRVPLHANGEQASDAGATHWPVLLQAPGGV
jgi:hypothetical protein